MAAIVVHSEKYKNALATCSLLSNSEDKDIISNIIHTSCDRLVRPKVVDTTVFPLFVVGKSLNEMLDAVECVICDAIHHGLSAEQFKEALKNVPGSVAKELVDIYQMRKHEIALNRAESIATISEAFLKDFDWSLRVVMGTSDLSITRKAILLLKLSVEDPNGKVLNKTYEMDLDSLNDLLKKFDRIATATQKLRIA
eukprot:g8427.t1